MSRTRIVPILLFAISLSVSSGCSVYFNLFFNAKKAFNKAENAREESETGTAGRNDYNRAIEKAQKVVENYPNSKYYDDAVYMLGVSYYHTDQYAKAERRFRELLANYEDSKFAKESSLYLAKSKLMLGDIEDARGLFEEVFEEDYSRQLKGEAAMVLGEYHFEEKEYELSRTYFLAVRDSLGDDVQKRRAQTHIADGYYDAFRFKDAIGAYLQVLGMEPDKNQKYHSLYRAALCSYRLQRINDGLDYLNELMQDDLYYDSLGVLKLTVAEGYEYEDDLVQAEAAYEDVAKSTDRRLWQATAYYRLGLIYQFDYDQLDKAKDYYDQSSGAHRGSEVGQDALHRSSDIGKLETFAKNPLDSNATPEAIDEAAYTQYLLSELFWFKLNRPDTAILEMQYLIDSFPTAYYSPKAMIALAQMYREHREDSVAADSILKLALTKYPHSDYVSGVIAQLGLQGTAADTGYAELYYRRAEDYLVDDENIDSARANYQHIVDNFPDSKYQLSARFGLIWLTEMYDSPGDSSVIFAYQDFADSFAGTDLADEALRRISGSPIRRPEPTQEEKDEETPPESDTLQDSSQASQWARADTAQRYVDPLIALYYRPNGDSLIDIKLEPIEIIEEFEFPAEVAGVQQHDWKLYFQIQVDFSGKVIDHILKIPSGIEEIDERVKLTVSSMTFDGMEVSNRLISAGRPAVAEGAGFWFVYEYKVTKPEYLR